MFHRTGTARVKVVPQVDPVLWLSRLCLLIMVMALLSACGGGGKSSSGGGRSLASHKPAIVGPAAFTDKIEQALGILPAADRELVYVHTATIEYTNGHSRAEYGSRTMIAQRELDTSLTWLASVIVHEACHHKQLQETGRNCGVVYEQQCNARMLAEVSPRERAMLRNINAPGHEIAHAESLDGTHGPCA